MPNRRVAVRRWLVTGPVPVRLVLPLLSIPFGWAAAVALFGSSKASVWVIVAVAATTGVRVIRNESSHRVVRERVFDAVRTGVPSGDPAVDSVVADRLTMAARQGRVTRLAGAALLVVIVAAPVAAALRADVWWLLCYAGLPVLAAAFPTESYRRPGARWERFQRLAS